MKLLFLDTETTGKETSARLVQLAFRAGINGEIFTYLFKPMCPISFEAMATHHITAAMIADKQPFAESLEKRALQYLLDENIMVAHNAAFDKQILENEGLRVGGVIDTLKVCQRLYDEPMYKLQYFRYKLNLEAAGAVAHDAGGDVEVLSLLFQHLLVDMVLRNSGQNALSADEAQQWENKAIAEMIEITGEPVLLRRIGFGKHKGMAFSELPIDYLEWLQGKANDFDADLIYTVGKELELRNQK